MGGFAAVSSAETAAGERAGRCACCPGDVGRRRPAAPLTAGGTAGQGRRVRSLALLVLALAFGVLPLLRSRPALAHAIFVSAVPAPGARLRSAPPQLRIAFSEPLNAGQSGVAVLNSAGRPTTAQPAHVDPTNNRALLLPLPPLAPGVYSVDWHTVSLVDGHLRRGVYTFTVLNPDGSVPAAGAVRPPAQPLQLPAAVSAGLRWLALTGVFLLTGAVLLRLLAPDACALDDLRQRLLIAGLCLLALGGAGELFGQWLPFGGAAAAGVVLRSRVGVWWIVRAAAAIMLVLSAAHRPRLPAPSPRWLGPPLLLVVAAGFAATSHGAASARPWWGAAFDFAHLLAAALWIGGVLALALSLRAAKAGEQLAAVRPLVKRFSIVAGAAVPVVLLSGLASATIELHDPGDLLHDGYGRSLLIKLVLIGALLGIAGANAFVLRRAYLDGRPQSRLFRRAVLAEAAAGLAVLVPLAALTVFAPSRSVDEANAAARRYARDPNPPASFTASLLLGSHAATLSVTPATLGANAARLEVEGVADTAAAELRLAAPDGRTATAVLTPAGTESEGNAVFEGTVQLAGPAGGWRAAVSLPAAGSATLPLTIAPAERAAAGGPRRGWLLALALLAAAGALLALTRLRAVRVVRFAATGAGGGLIAAALVAGVVTAARSSGSAGAATWGILTREQPSAAAGLTSWAIPTPHAGLMTPAVGPDGAVWIGEMDTNKLARLDPAANTVQEYRFSGGYQGTMGVAVDSGNRVWLAQQSAGTLGLFDPASGAYTAFPTATPHAAPSGIAIAPDGAVWLTEMNVDRLAHFDPATRSFREYPLPEAGVVPYWLTVAPDGRVWFTELSGLRVGVLDPASGAVREWPVPNGEHPSGIAAAPNGTVWFATTEGSLVRVDPASGAVVATVTPGRDLYGVAVGADGTAWIGSASGDAVLAYGPASGRFVSHPVPRGSGPWWPVVGGDGSVWVALAAQATGALARLEPAAGSPSAVGSR